MCFSGALLQALGARLNDLSGLFACVSCILRPDEHRYLADYLPLSSDKEKGACSEAAIVIG